MRKAPARKRRDSAEGKMRPEYRLDYSKARPNRFAGQMSPGAVAVVLEPEVASVFDSSAAVNTLLRSVIKAMPNHGKRRRKAG